MVNNIRMLATDLKVLPCLQSPNLLSAMSPHGQHSYLHTLRYTMDCRMLKKLWTKNRMFSRLFGKGAGIIFLDSLHIFSNRNAPQINIRITKIMADSLYIWPSRWSMASGLRLHAHGLRQFDDNTSNTCTTNNGIDRHGADGLFHGSRSPVMHKG